MPGHIQSHYPAHPIAFYEPPRLLVRAFVVLIIFLIASVVVLATFHTSQLLALVESTNVLPGQIVSPEQQPSTANQMGSAARDADKIIKANGQFTIGVAIEDISTGKVEQIGETKQFTAASTGKLLTALDYYHGVEIGKYKLDMPLGAYTAQFQLKELINDSDNDSWALLYGYMGNKQLSQYAASIGVTYNIYDNKLTTVDLAEVLSKLYGGKLLNDRNTKQLLSYMQHTNWESLIPAALPKDITVYHKYGLIDGNLHDASIIVKDGKAYSFVVMTKSKDNGDDDDRTTIIREITRAVAGDLFA